MTKRMMPGCVSVFGIALALATPAAAGWPTTPSGVPVCMASGDQRVPEVVTDGAGGVIIAWTDLRTGTLDIYAHHVLASGDLDPAWPLNGLAVCTAPGQQRYHAVASDGAGGAIVCWQDERGDDGTGKRSDIFAQHVLASGVVDPAWPIHGRVLCAATGLQLYPQIASDGGGGAIVAWEDLRDNSGTWTTNADVYAQHVLSTGVVDPAWPVDGRAVCAATNIQMDPTLVADTAGGAFVAWDDVRSGTNVDAYAHHVLASGALDPAWPVDGLLLRASADNQVMPAIVADGSGGAFVAWEDGGNTPNADPYAQHVLAGGGIDPAWPAAGRTLCAAARSQWFPAIVADGAGGAIVSWVDQRFGPGVSRVYAQRVLAGGATDASWPDNGREICAAPDWADDAKLVIDGEGGAIIVWDQGTYSGTRHIYAQRVQSNGELGGDHTVAVGTSLIAAETIARTVRLTWYVAPGATDRATVYRTTRDEGWREIAAVEVAPSRRIVYEDAAVEPGARYGYRLGVLGPGGERFFGEVWVTVPATAGLALDEPQPNPARRDLVVSFALPIDAPAVVELIDLSGRVVASRRVEDARAGSHRLELLEGSPVAPGVYLVRLGQTGRHVTRKACLIR